jgi:tRNA(Ile)-lysidine synthase
VRGGLSTALPFPKLPVPAFIQDKFSEFAARLDGDGPVGVAVSGGGDSVALLYALAAWGQRPLEVFCVDHGLNPLSPQWTQSVADHAAKLGACSTALHWQGDKPSSGLAAAARLARHRLLAEAARGKGVAVLCLAHTADDVAEAEAMRTQGSSVGTPRVWSPSPVWPEGRDVFLYRPFLDVRRAALRDYLRGIGAAWIEDPANENPHSLRARTRKALHDQPLAKKAPETQAALTASQVRALLHEPEVLAPLGMIAFRADIFHALPHETALKVLAAAAVCAGGGDKLPKTDKIAALSEHLPSGKAVTLCGARLRQEEGLIRICRETGDIGRGGRCLVSVPTGAEVAWDGRFTVTAPQDGRIWPSGSLRPDLSGPDRDWLLTLPVPLRGSQPVFVSDEQKDNQNICLLTNPALRHGAHNDFGARCLVMPRFYAALGLITAESAVKTKNDCVLMRINDV